MADYAAPEKIRIVYFSGTGGTRMAAEKLAASLSARGVTVFMQELSVHEPSDEPNKEDLLILLYPVYALNAPGPIYNYIKKHSDVEKNPAAVISVSGGGEVTPNKACRRHAIRLLEKKGYSVVYERMLVMPSNVLVALDDAQSARLLHILPEKTDQIAEELLHGVTRRTHPDLMNSFLAAFGECEKIGAKWFGRLIRTDENCTGCGLCAASCPMGNIKMIEAKPEFGKKCVTCLRCIYGCPEKAINLRAGKLMILKKGFDINTIESLAANKTVFTEKLPKGAAWSGVRRYLEEKD